MANLDERGQRAESGYGSNLAQQPFPIFRAEYNISVSKSLVAGDELFQIEYQDFRRDTQLISFDLLAQLTNADATLQQGQAEYVFIAIKDTIETLVSQTASGRIPKHILSAAIPIATFLNSPGEVRLSRTKALLVKECVCPQDREGGCAVAYKGLCSMVRDRAA